MKKNNFLLILCLTLIGCSQIFAQKKCKSSYDSVIKRTVFITAEDLPTFPGGKVAMMKYLRENFIYTDRESGQNRFIVEFVVNEDGMVVGERIRSKEPKDISEVESELLKVVASMPKWNPAKCNGAYVPFRLIIPINY